MAGIYSVRDGIIGVQSALGGRGGGLRYLLRDEFTTDRAAGAVNGTAAEPGPGTRTVVDTQSKLQIASGELDFISGTGLSDDPRLFYDTAITREAGRLALFDVRSNSNNFWVTFASSVAGAGGYRIWLHDVLHVDNTDGTAIGTNAASLYALILRVSGAMYFSKSSGGQWVLRWLHTTGTTTPLYVGVSQYFTENNVGFIRVPTAKWLPTPLLSDGFGSAFGTSDGLGHAEGVAGGIGAGGSGVTLSNTGGTWSVSGGKAINTAPSGLVQQISVANLSCADVYAGVAMTRALLTNVGLALNFDSASSPANGLLIYSDGAGNIKVDKIVAGSTTNVSTTAYTYSAGARLVATMNAGALRTYYNGALVKADTIVDAGILTGQFHGLFSSDQSNQLDDLVIYATGVSGEYGALDAY